MKLSKTISALAIAVCLTTTSFADEIFFTVTDDVNTFVQVSVLGMLPTDSGSSSIQMPDGGTAFLLLWSDGDLRIDPTTATGDPNTGQPFGLVVDAVSSNTAIVAADGVSSYDSLNPTLTGGDFAGETRWFSTDLTISNWVAAGDNSPAVGGNNPGVGPDSQAFDPFYDSVRGAFLIGIAQVTVDASGGPGFTTINPLVDDAFSLDGTQTVTGVAIGIPEPTTAGLLAFGLAGLIVRRRR